MALSQESIIHALADSCFDLCDRFGLDLESTVEVAHRFMGIAITERKNARSTTGSELEPPFAESSEATLSSEPSSQHSSPDPSITATLPDPQLTAPTAPTAPTATHPQPSVSTPKNLKEHIAAVKKAIKARKWNATAKNFTYVDQMNVRQLRGILRAETEIDAMKAVAAHAKEASEA